MEETGKNYGKNNFGMWGVLLLNFTWNWPFFFFPTGIDVALPASRSYRVDIYRFFLFWRIMS